MYFIAIFIILLDQWIKNIISNNMIFNQSIPVIKDIFHLTYIKNSGAGFGILQGFKNFFIVITIVIAIIIIIYHYKKEKSLLLNLAAGFILGGAAGNLIDRIRWGYVIDYLDFRIWPVFNLADSSLVLGVGLLIVYLWKYEERL